MNGIPFVLIWIFMVATCKEVTINANSIHKTLQQVSNADKSEQIHDKIAYIAATIDRQHSQFIDGLKSTGVPHLQAKAVIQQGIGQHMLNVTKTILPELKSLMTITDNREQSAAEVNKHFAEDHVDPMLQKIFGEEKNHPKFYNSLRKSIAESAQNQIRMIFKHYKRNT